MSGRSQNAFFILIFQRSTGFFLLSTWVFFSERHNSKMSCTNFRNFELSKNELKNLKIAQKFKNKFVINNFPYFSWWRRFQMVSTKILTHSNSRSISCFYTQETDFAALRTLYFSLTFSIFFHRRISNFMILRGLKSWSQL